MKSWFLIQNRLDPIQIDDDVDVRFSIELPRRFIEEYTQEGDTVFDPFAGFGTTIFAAQELCRVGIGIEYEQNRVDYIAQQMTAPSKIIHGDSRKLSSYDIPQCDLSFTSPPYMRAFDTENPMTNYNEVGNYDMYLKQIGDIYKQLRDVMKADARVIVEIENTYEEGQPVTPLAWDVAEVLSRMFFFEKDMIACRDTASPKTDHSYILVFRK